MTINCYTFLYVSSPWKKEMASQCTWEKICSGLVVRYFERKSTER